jgi:TRAP-type mannitol/chloroaromatic compound transport system substrate-binding protein
MVLPVYHYFFREAMMKIFRTFVATVSCFFAWGSVVLAEEVWLIQSHLPAGHVVFKNQQDWVKEVNTMLGGRLKLELLSGGSVVPPNETIDAVGAGTIDGDITSPAYFAGRDPAFAMLADLVGGYENWTQALAWCELGGGKELLQEIYRGYNAHLAGCANAGIESVASTKPIRKIENFEGVKIRAPQGLASSIFAKMGASPVNMGMADVFLALEKGVVDAADISSYAMNSQGGYHEIAKYPILDFHSLPVLSVSFNLDKYNTQPDDIKAILNMAVRDLATQINLKDMLSRGEAMASDAEKGVEVIIWSAEDKQRMRDIARSVWEEAAAKSELSRRAYESQTKFLQTVGLIE